MPMLEDAILLGIAELFVHGRSRSLDERGLQELLELRRLNADEFATRMERYAPVRHLFESVAGVIRVVEMPEEHEGIERPTAEYEECELIQSLASQIVDEEGGHDEPIGIVLDAFVLAFQERLMQGRTEPASNLEVIAALELRLNNAEEFESRMEASACAWEQLDGGFKP